MQKRDLFIIFGALIAAAILVVSQFFFGVVQTGAWGLGFGNGAIPTAPESRDSLAKYDAFYIGDPEDKVLYLTFDAGYENGCTAEILDILKKHNISAAFFLVGNYIERNPDLVRRMVDEGHIVGNHTMQHRDMSKITDREKFNKELLDLENLFRETTGKALPKFYRPPQGVYSAENLQYAKDLGYKTIFWSLAYADWDNQNQPEESAAIQKLLSRTHNGAVILLHSTSQTNAKILDRLLTHWEQQGYRFGRLDEL